MEKHPKKLSQKLEIIASDGYIKSVKYSDLGGFNFSKNYFYYYGIIEKYESENSKKLQSLSQLIHCQLVKLMKT
jgi:hypothetical protein